MPKNSSFSAGLARVLILIIILAITSASLSGCARKKKADANKDGGALRLTSTEIQEQGRSGLFVLNEDKTFTPVLTDVPGYSNVNKTSDPSRYLWFTDATVNTSALVPTVTKNTPLVAIYSKSTEMPREWYLEQYVDRGYTVGCHIKIDSDMTIYLETQKALNGTSAKAAISQIKNAENEYVINKISGSESLPLANVDPNMNILLGLQKNMAYTFSFYRGTKADQISVYADTRIFQSVKHIDLSNPYEKTNKGYFIVNLPMNLDSGYYYVAGTGLIYYNAS